MLSLCMAVLRSAEWLDEHFTGDTRVFTATSKRQERTESVQNATQDIVLGQHQHSGCNSISMAM